jgi:D-erythronate 2-dehydrogenase
MEKSVHALVTGSEGFVGKALVRRLLAHGVGGRSVRRLTLLDTRFADPLADERVVQMPGSIVDEALRQRAYASAVDVVFHLASVPGGSAEKDYALGRAVNLDATLGLIEDLRAQSRRPRFVFASTIAVYGQQTGACIDESTLPAPALSYGAHKLIDEILIADATRRGWIEGCSLRLPGVVARPGDGEGMMSGFMSLLFWRLAAGEPISVPVSPEGVAWWISVGACVDNLLHAATIDPARLDARRSYPMPVLRLTMREVVAALAARFGRERAELVTYAPDPFIEKLFAAYPPFSTPHTEALGFAHDGSVERLIERALSGS